MAKSRTYGCKVPKGSSRKGCGGNAKVFELGKRIEKLERGISELDKRHDRNLAEHKKNVAAQLKKKAAKKK